MDNTQKVSRMQEEDEIDLLKLLVAIKDNIIAIILTATIFSGLFFGFTYFFITPKYKATVSFYVNTSSTQSLASSLFSSTSTAIATNRLVDTYLFILDSRETLEEVCTESGEDVDYVELRKMISTDALDSATGFKVSVLSSNPVQAEKIANTIATVLPTRISDIVDGTSTRIVDHAIIPTQRSSPSYSKNAMIGFAAGAILAAGIVVVLDLIRSSQYVLIESAEDLREYFADYPVLAMIPDMRLTNKKGYYSNYSYYSDDKKVAK